MSYLQKSQYLSNKNKNGYNQFDMVTEVSFCEGNNPMVGATVAVAVAVEKALNK